MDLVAAEEWIRNARRHTIGNFPGQGAYRVLNAAFPNGRITLMAYAFDWPVAFTQADDDLLLQYWEKLAIPYRSKLTEDERVTFLKGNLARIFRYMADPHAPKNKPGVEALNEMGINVYDEPMLPMWYDYLKSLPQDATIIISDTRRVKVNSDVLFLRYPGIYDIYEESDTPGIVDIRTFVDRIQERLDDIGADVSRGEIDKILHKFLIIAYRTPDLEKIDMTIEDAMIRFIIIDFFRASEASVAPIDSFLAIHASRPEVTAQFVDLYKNQLPIAYSAKKSLFPEEFA